MATEDWQLVGDINCNPKYLGLIRPPYELPRTMFVMDFKIKMKSAQSSGDDEEVIDEWDFRLHGLEYNPYAMWLAIDKALRYEQLVPSQVRAAIEDPILKGTRAARVDSSYGAREYLHMEVDVEFHVGVYEPAFVPASEVSISKLEKTRLVDQVTMCTVCMENMMDGSEATRLPCSHLYHENCIVEWLRNSGVCPCCKFRLPTEGDAYDR